MKREVYLQVNLQFEVNDDDQPVSEVVAETLKEIEDLFASQNEHAAGSAIRHASFDVEAAE